MLAAFRFGEPREKHFFFKHACLKHVFLSVLTLRAVPAFAEAFSKKAYNKLAEQSAQ